MSVSAIILAAGLSTRMGLDNKLLLPWNGSTMIRQVLSAVQAAHLSETIVVVGHDHDAVTQEIQDFSPLVVFNPEYSNGIGGSIARGVAAASPEAEGYLIILGDMPFVSSELLNVLLSRSRSDVIAYPTFLGNQRNPVFFGSKFRDELTGLHGNMGARSIIGRYPEAHVVVPWEDELCFVDLDTPESFR